MLVAAIPAMAFGTNCYVLAPAAGEECVVVDPGIGVAKQVDDILREQRLRPVAVLLTHGHLDHTFSVAPVCKARGIAAYVHPADDELLADPSLSLGGGARVGMSALSAMLGGRFSYTEPDDVRPLADGATMELAGLSFTVDHAPGHTRGSVLFHLPQVPGGPGGADAASPGATCLSGDVLFAGSIGRTDLPGGDHAAMLRSLATKILPLADDTVVLPGHGPATTVGRERSANPFLQDLAH